jgi:phthalate 4,5-cis-dihydrodiol dehydrogenase
MTGSVRLGIIGYGLAVEPVVRGVADHDDIEVVACADPDPRSQQRFVSEVGAEVYTSAEELLERAAVDAVYIATPTRTHEELTMLAFAYGVDVLVEKPIATTLAAGVRMVRAARDAGRVLMVNHKRSADREILAMRRAIRAGAIGEVRYVSRWHGSDWMYRARAAEERDPEFGGVVLRQGAHEFDVIAALLTATPTRVRGMVGDWAPDRPGEGWYNAWLECGASVATSTYNGYDRFRTDELTVGPMPEDLIGASQRATAERERQQVDELDLKRTVGHPRAAALPRDMYGFTFVTGELGELRAAPGRTAWLYDADGRHTVSADGPAGSALLVEELHRAVRLGQPPAHDGGWGLRCLELCEAVRSSSATGEFVSLAHQDGHGTVPFPGDSAAFGRVTD